jgi:hypothetical protein
MGVRVMNGAIVIDYLCISLHRVFIIHVCLFVCLFCFKKTVAIMNQEDMLWVKVNFEEADQMRDCISFLLKCDLALWKTGRRECQ